jgi:hypothetical protein
MTASGIRKLGWHWTRKGWKRTPKHGTAKAPRKPTQAQERAVARRLNDPPRVKRKAAPKEKPPTFAEARKKAAEQGKADSAPTPAPEAAKPATRQMRQAWSGKYAGLGKSTD